MNIYCIKIFAMITKLVDHLATTRALFSPKMHGICNDFPPSVDTTLRSKKSIKGSLEKVLAVKHFKSVGEGVHKFTSKAQNLWNVKTADKFTAVEGPLERQTLRKIASEPKNRYIPFRKITFPSQFFFSPVWQRCNSFRV